MEVTFDSNVWEAIVVPQKLAIHPDRAALQSLKDAIHAGKIMPYISDVIVTFEAVRSKDRQAFFQAITLRTTMREEGGVHHVNVATDFTHHPGANKYLLDALGPAFKMGFKFIKVPRVAWMMAEKPLYKNIEDEAELGKVLNRCCEAMRLIEGKGFGAAEASRIGKELIDKDPSAGPSPLIAFASSKNDRIPEIVAEWADGDALAAHYGYGHDVFCTYDQGKGAGKNSVLHKDQRAWLRDNLGIKILSPVELVSDIQSGVPS